LGKALVILATLVQQVLQVVTLDHRVQLAILDPRVLQVDILGRQVQATQDLLVADIPDPLVQVGILVQQAPAAARQQQLAVNPTRLQTFLVFHAVLLLKDPVCPTMVL
jgi:hypothetical protein